MCTELNVPLAKKRSDKDSQELSNHWTEVGTMELGKVIVYVLALCLLVCHKSIVL